MTKVEQILVYINLVLTITSLVSIVILFADINRLKLVVIIYPFALFFYGTALLAVDVVFSSTTKDKMDYEYIRTNHPDLWKKLSPFGNGSYNNLATLVFLLGNNNNENDIILEKIRKKWRKRNLIFTWPFIVAIINFIPVIYVVINL